MKSKKKEREKNWWNEDKGGFNNIHIEYPTVKTRKIKFEL